MSTSPSNPEPQVYQRLGELTRMLHDALHELGYDKEIEQAASQLPDARSRLSFIAEKTGDSAERTLNLVDRAKAEQEQLQAAAAAAAADLKRDPVRAVATGRMLEFIEQVQTATGTTDAALTDIMMAQDFHDLTGQVIRKVVDTAQRLEQQLLALLLEAAPQVAPRATTEFLNGPVVDAAARTDVVTDQSQVDDLLESLGF